MAIKAFESALNDVVKAKRLSQSKMNTLTEVALKCIENDTQMVSILYRTHKGLSSTAKIWSLYAFDALARAARHQVNKNNLVADVNSEQGNCATFLLKIEGILDGLFEDLVSTGTVELKGKAKKILDIWTKSNTFPSAVLSPLYALLQQAEKEKEPDRAVQSANTLPNTPIAPIAPPHQAPSATPAFGNADVQSTLLALLSRAANAVGANGSVNGQTAPNTALVPPPGPAPPVTLDANQLALLQHLAQTAKGNTVPAQSAVPVPASVVSSLTAPNAVPVVPPVPPQPQPYGDDHYGPASASAHAPRRESEQQQMHHHGQFDGPRDGGYHRNDYHDQNGQPPQHPSYTNEYPSHDPRGGAYNHRSGYRDRGGPGPGRGRGRGRWDELGGRDWNSAHNQNGSYDTRGRRSSRSRSPPGRFRGGPGGQAGMGMNGRVRDARPYSPPRRAPYRDSDGQYNEPRRQAYDTEANAAAGLDEFGRELRTGSPARSVAGSDNASVSAHAEIHMQASGNPGDSPAPPRSASVTTSDRGSAAPETVGHGHGHSHLYTQSYADCQPQHQSQPHGIRSDPSTSVSVFSPSTSTGPVGAERPSQSHGGGLDAFDRASFDPSQPASWDALGKAWMATHGSMPSQEELMQFVFADMALPPAAMESNQNQFDDDSGSLQQQQRQQYAEGRRGQGRGQWGSNRGFGQRGGWRGRGGGHAGQGRGYGRGRGDYGHGGYGDGQEDYGRGGYTQASLTRGDYGHGPRRGPGDYHGRDDSGQEHGYGRGEPVPAYDGGNTRGSAYSGGGRGYSNYQDTDAVTLTGGGEDYSDSWQDQSLSSYEPTQPQQWRVAPPDGPQADHEEVEGGAGSTGKMQKVGDKWVFVRGAA